jgi:hypothetical protein
MFDKATGGLLTLGARAVGIGGKTGTPLVPGAVLSERGGIKGFGALEDYDTAVRKIRDIVETVGDRHTNPFPETLAADDIAKQAEQAGGTIDLSKVVEYIDGLVKAPVQVGKTVSMRAKSAKAASLQFRDRGLSAEMKNVLEGMYDIADKNGVASLASAPAPIGFSIALKRDLQAKAAGEGGYGATQAILGQESRDALETAARMINQEVRSALKATGLQSPDGRTYDKLMDVVSKKTEVLKYWKKGLNRGATEADRHNNAVSLISGVFNKSKGGTHEFAVNFDKYFGTDITSLMKRPIIGEAFGEQGAASIMPRMTATGLPMGSALLGGMLGGSKGHPVAGAIAGGAIASPMSVLAMTKAGQALAKFGSGPAGALAGASPATRSALLAATQELSRRFTPEMP